MIIGCIKEVKDNENRVGLTPSGTEELINAGHTVMIQECAGVGAGFHDFEYKDAGAIIEKDAGHIATNCDILVKVKEPIESEYHLLEKMAGKTIYTYFHLSGVNPELTDKLLEYNVTAIAYETVEDKNSKLPLLKPMSEIAGIAAIQYAAELSQIKHGGRGRTLGEVEGATKTKVMIVGGGVVGELAARTAGGMGSQVKIFDINPKRAEQLQKNLAEYLGPNLIKNVEVLIPNAQNFDVSVEETDVLIGAVLVPGTRAPEVINEKQVRSMKNGAVIIDIAIDQGGCIWGAKATKHSDPYYVNEGKIYSCVANIPGQFARQSTQALTTATFPYLLNMANEGVIEACLKDHGLMKGINTYKGYITYKSVANDLDMQDKHCDLESLLIRERKGIKTEKALPQMMCNMRNV